MAVELKKVVDDRVVSALPELSALRGRRVVFTVVPEEDQAGSGGQVVLGTLRGRIRVGDDFDAALPDDVLRDFDGT